MVRQVRILPIKSLRERAAERKAQKPPRAQRRLLRRLSLADPTGVKRWFIPGSEFEGEGVMTPYANKERRRRRAARRVAHESRRINSQGRR